MITVAQFASSTVLAEQQMVPMNPPKDPTASTSKRKPDENDILGKAAKKLKSDGSTRSKKGEEIKGGLVIVRGLPPRPASAQSNHKPPPNHASNLPPRATSAQSDYDPPIDPLKQPQSKRSYLDPDDRPLKPPAPTTTSASRKENAHSHIRTLRPSPQPTAADRAVEEDVRMMNSEADNLRERSRSSAAHLSSPGGAQPEFAFPPPTAKSTSKSRSRNTSQSDSHSPLDSTPSSSNSSLRNGVTISAMRKVKDTMQPIAEQETPQIAKNRMMRGQLPSAAKKAPPESLSVAGRRQPSTEPGPSNSSVSDIANGHASSSTPGRRRSSMGMRGKRLSASFDASGIVAQPHTSVSDSALYKHIDADLPEPERARQLLIWAATRSMAVPSSSSAISPGKAKAKAKQAETLPPLPPEGMELLKEMQEEFIRRLTEKMIDTNVYSPPGSGKASGPENEQNLKNLKREKAFLQQIEDRKNEDAAWAEVVQFYNAHQTNVLASIEKEKRERRSRTPLSSKGKGKERAVESETYNVRVNELPDKFSGPRGFDVARRLMEMGKDNVGKGGGREQDARIKEDRIHQTISAAYQFAKIASSDLDRRFTHISSSLAQRSQHIVTTSATNHNPDLLSNYLPISPTPLDPGDILRALARTEAARPRSQIGDAAWKAAKDVQRVNNAAAHSNDGGSGASLEKKFTDIPPPTPRKIPGTPRRQATPTSEPGRRSAQR